MPELDAILDIGQHRIARSAMPSFTNPNNVSIVTGAPPAVHGICGNYLLDPESKAPVMMNDPSWLRAPTILAALHAAERRVAVVTAKDKLRQLLGHGIECQSGRAVCFSAECADRSTAAENGVEDATKWLDRPLPAVYSAELSEFVFAAGVRLLDEFRPHVMYLTTTDYVQHKHAPGTAAANEFYAMVDRYLGELHRAGAILLITADHGMRAKHAADGTPNAIYAQDLLDHWLAPNAAQVILPITDPYIVHHGALGSFATVYMGEPAHTASILDRFRATAGIAAALDRDAAAATFELPPDRIGDIVLIADPDQTIGTRKSEHDLSGLDAPLRSHGGLSEQEVPFILNRPQPLLPDGPTLRNFDAFYHAMAAAHEEPSGQSET